MTRYTVPVVVFAEVEGVDYGDAANIAERAVAHGLWEASNNEDSGRDVLTFVATGREYRAAVDVVSELDRAVNRGDIRMVARAHDGRRTMTE